MKIVELDSAGPDVADNGIQVIFSLIIENDETQLKKLLEEEVVDINRGDEDELTPLHLAVELEKEPMVRLLVEAGAQLNRFTLELKLTPLHIAVRNGSLKIADYLLDNGADVNASNKLDLTPLHIAVSTKNIEMARLLLFWRADPNLRTSDPRKESPLVKAATISADLTNLLLYSGAKVSPEAKELHVSILANKPEIANIILDNLPNPCQLVPNRIGRTPLQSVASHISNCEPQIAVKLITRLTALGDDVNYINLFGTLFHILINRNAFAKSTDPVAVACFDSLLAIPGRDCNQLVPSNNMGTPLTLAFKLNQTYFAEKLIKDAVVDVHQTNLDEFKFTSDSVRALKLMHCSGFRLNSALSANNKPRNSEDQELAQTYSDFRKWLESQGQVMSLKALVRVMLRSHLREKTSQVLWQLRYPRLLIDFVNFEDIDSSL